MAAIVFRRGSGVEEASQPGPVARPEVRSKRQPGKGKETIEKSGRSEIIEVSRLRKSPDLPLPH
jgi:hypothetical protein